MQAWIFMRKGENMKNSNKTIKRYVSTINELTAEYNKTSEYLLPVCITKGNSKIGKSLNVSLPAVISCGNCADCVHYCYAIANTIYRGWNGSVIKARARNWSVFSRNRDLFFNRISYAMDRAKTIRTLRFHVEGEIVDMDHFGRIVKLAAAHPGWKIWMYSKMDIIVDAYISKYGPLPSNLSVMRSQWGTNKRVENPYNLGRFITVLPGENPPAGIWECPYDCEICKRAGRGCIVNETSYVHLH